MAHMSESGITRRDFMKGAAVTAAGIAIASSGIANINLPRAFAAADLADGTYKVNANLYISKRIVLIGVSAYFTNPTDPNDGQGMPSSPNTELNAIMVVKDGVPTVTVPLVNECFMLLEAESGGGAVVVGTKTQAGVYPDEDGNTLTRISEITFELANTGGEYELGACKEYAAYQNPPFPMYMLVPGYLEWTATLSVDFSTAVTV